MATSQIATNMSAVLTHNVFAKNNAGMSAALGRVSTGLKINSAKDNASQYAISEKMLERINSNQQASQNVQNDNALMKTAEDGIANTVSILKTLKARALDAANDANTNDDRAIIQKEVDKLVAQINDNATNVKYNGKSLLNGTISGNVVSSTNAAAFLSDSGAGTSTFSATFGVAATDGIIGTVYWTKSDGEASSSAISGLTGAKTLFDGITATNTVSGITFAQVSNEGDTTINASDTAGAQLHVVGKGISAIASTAGDAGTISGITFKFTAANDNSKSVSYSFSQIQRGKDAKTTDNSLNFQIGEEAGFSTKLDIDDMSTKGLGITKLKVNTRDNAISAIGAIDTALNVALSEQTKIGAVEQRLGYVADNLDTINENLQASNSAIRDADLSKDISEYMKYSVLSQSAQYMLAQSHQNAFQVLNLLQ